MSLYLIAVLTPNDINTEVKQWKDYMHEHYNCQVALKSPAHITLIPPFNLPDDEVAWLKKLLDEFASQQKQIPVELKNFAVFAPRVIYVDVMENPLLAVLQSKLESMLISQKFPIKKEQRSFHPHVTIANRDLKKEDFPNAWSYFKTLSYQASFPMKSVSLLKHNGKKWELLHDALLP